MALTFSSRIEALRYLSRLRQGAQRQDDT